VAALNMAHPPREASAPRAYDDHGHGGDRYAAGSTTLGPSSAEVDGARGVAADDARSSPGPGTSVRDSDGVDGDYHARNDLAAAWYSWMTSPSGTSNPRHLTKRLRAARGAFRRLDGLPPLLARWSAPRPGDIVTKAIVGARFYSLRARVLGLRPGMPGTGVDGR